MNLVVAARSDIGRKRTNNEDRYKVSEEASLFLVADGMGGHTAGEIASKIAVDTIEDFILNSSAEDTWPFDFDDDLPEPCNRLRVAIQLANEKIYHLATTQDYFEGMGTTIVALWCQEHISYLAHVGDSRIYLMRNHELQQLTQDHSWVNMQVNLGVMDAVEARRHPWKNIITRALGTKSTVEVDAALHSLEKGDLFLLCTDGLTASITDDRLAVMIDEHHDDLEALASALIAQANFNGGDDNITVVLVRVVDEAEETVRSAKAEQENNDEEEEITEILTQEQLEGQAEGVAAHD